MLQCSKTPNISLSQEIFNPKAVTGGRGVTVHSDTLHHTTISW